MLAHLSRMAAGSCITLGCMSDERQLAYASWLERSHTDRMLYSILVATKGVHVTIELLGCHLQARLMTGAVTASPRTTTLDSSPT
jgi:hypothetical protein